MNNSADTMIWGVHPVLEALRSRRREIRKVYLALDRTAGRRGQMAEAARQAGVQVEWLSPQQISLLVGHGRHQGAAALVSELPEAGLDEALAAAAAAHEDPFLLLLDQVVDPQNLGAIARTAQCAGVHGLVATCKRSAPVTAAADKASAGALEHLRIISVTNLVAAIETLKAGGVWVAGADRNGNRPLFGTDLKGPLALVIGGEEKGLRPLVRKHCDFTLAIPQRGPIGSLNASVAAAVIMYEIFRQRL